MKAFLICLGMVVIFFILLLTKTIRCNGGMRNDDFEAITPNACVDMMEKGASPDAVNACVAYSQKCDAAYGPWHSPIVGAEVAALYMKYGISPASAITDQQSQQLIAEFNKGICVNYIKCSSSADCPNPLQCSLDNGQCQ